ncbi:hypothetical protein [Mycoplasma suis]|uniref:Uncharacterized protein n=1 Tax=Mycoplasma suis (strain Illinois) TaxID=768700 RepID=F0QS12_MYCSL|nr:hypothetical protein [Mycoplasma suis]ADX98282.1 hypothetical protein MSU_0757 [Mycoplasma suis str. Illinois]
MVPWGGGIGSGLGSLLGSSQQPQSELVKKEEGPQGPSSSINEKETVQKEIKVKPKSSSQTPTQSKSRTPRSVNTGQQVNKPRKSYSSMTLQEKIDWAIERFTKQGWTLWKEEGVMKKWERHGDKTCDHTKYLDGDLRPLSITCYKTVVS